MISFAQTAGDICSHHFGYQNTKKNRGKAERKKKQTNKVKKKEERKKKEKTNTKRKKNGLVKFTLTLKEREKKTNYKLEEDKMNRYQQKDEPKM